jgi:hypothetical protein
MAINFVAIDMDSCSARGAAASEMSGLQAPPPRAERRRPTPGRGVRPQRVATMCRSSSPGRTLRELRTPPPHAESSNHHHAPEGTCAELARSRHEPPDPVCGRSCRQIPGGGGRGVCGGVLRRLRRRATTSMAVVSGGCIRARRWAAVGALGRKRRARE